MKIVKNILILSILLPALIKASNEDQATAKPLVTIDQDSYLIIGNPKNLERRLK